MQFLLRKYYIYRSCILIFYIALHATHLGNSYLYYNILDCMNVKDKKYLVSDLH